VRHPGRLASALLCFLAGVAPLGCAARRPAFPDSERIPAHILLPVGAPGVEDGRLRFREIFCGVLEREQDGGDGAACETYLHVLLDEEEPSPPPPPPPPQTEAVQLFFVPGLFNGCLEGALLSYNTAFRTLEERGYSIQRVPVSSFGSTGYNADRIAAAWPSLVRDPNRRLVLAGYSKGAPDILEFLLRYPELAADVDAVVTIAGAVNGSPVADETSELTMKVVQAGLPGCDRGDEMGIQSLRRPVRMSWLTSNPLPEHIRFYSLGVFTTDREIVSRGLLGGYDVASSIDPRTDGQLLAYDQIVPGSTLLGFANADHWAVAVPADADYPTLGPLVVDAPPFPRTVLIESILLYVGEDLARNPR